MPPAVSVMLMDYYSSNHL